MQDYVARHTAAAWMWKLGQRMSAWALTVRRSARQLDAWITERDKAGADRKALQAMSARELRDIGIEPSHVDGVAQGAWVRDWTP